MKSIVGRKREFLPEALLQGLDVTRLAFPYRQHTPAQLLQLGFLSSVTLDVRRKLWQPEILTSLWSRRVTTSGMSMPEAAMDEHNGIKLWKNYIWRAGQLFSVESKSQTQ